MDGHTVCPRCGARDSFIKGYLPETCVCRICQSQLDWREIPGCGPDCGARAEEPQAELGPVGQQVPAERVAADAAGQTADAAESDTALRGTPGE
jgi:hypothetical protein